MKTIAFLNQKGGVGKTTSAVSIGCALAHTHQQRVLLIDLDPQGNLSDHLGIDPNVVETSIYNVIIDGTPPHEVMQEAHGVSVIPANLDLSAAEIELAGMISRETRLKNAIEPLRDDFDFIFIDCPPSLGLLTISALSLADEVLVPMQAEYLALRGLSQLAGTLDLVRGHLNPTIAVGGVLFCMFDGRTNLARDVREEVEAHFPSKVYETAIRKNIRLAEAPSHGLPIDLYDKKSAGAEDYAAATKEFLRRSGKGDLLVEAPAAANATSETTEADAADKQTNPPPAHEAAPRREPIWKGDDVAPPTKTP